MAFFERSIRRASRSEVSDETDRDIAFKNFLRQRHEAHEREKAVAIIKAKEKETTVNGKKTCNC